MDKPVLSSLTVQTSIVTAIIGILTILRAVGIDTDLDDGMITETVGAIVFIVSQCLNLYGRLRVK